MNKIILTASSLVLLFSAQASYGFGSKPMQTSELKGVTDTQVAMGDKAANVMVRGKGAEILFNTMKQKQEDVADTDALKWIGSKDGTETVVHGQQVTCSKITKKDATDYACAFNLNDKGTVTAAIEAFDPSVFNLARTETGSKMFKKKKDRAVASVAPTASFSKGAAYLVYDKGGDQKDSENAMLVFRGDTAKDILGLLDSNTSNGETAWGDVKGRKGDDIACVNATDKEPARCAVVLAFKDGSTTRKGNALFR